MSHFPPNAAILKILRCKQYNSQDVEHTFLLEFKMLKLQESQKERVKADKKDRDGFSQREEQRNAK